MKELNASSTPTTFVVADWCTFNGIRTVFVDPWGANPQKRVIESFRASLRDELLKPIALSCSPVYRHFPEPSASVGFGASRAFGELACRRWTGRGWQDHSYGGAHSFCGTNSDVTIVRGNDGGDYGQAQSRTSSGATRIATPKAVECALDFKIVHAAAGISHFNDRTLILKIAEHRHRNPIRRMNHCVIEKVRKLPGAALPRHP